MKSKARHAPGPRRLLRVPTRPEVALQRHLAQCRICRHVRREEIEADFLDWVPAREIAEEYKLGSHRAVYRHAHALELFRMRRGYVERVLDGIVERSGEAKLTTGSVVAAIKMLVELSWGEKKIHLEIMREGVSRSAAVRDLEAGADESHREGDRKEEKRAGGSASASAHATWHDEDGDGGIKLKGYAGKILRELQLSHGLARARISGAAALPAAASHRRHRAGRYAHDSNSTNSAERHCTAKADRCRSGSAFKACRGCLPGRSHSPRAHGQQTADRGYHPGTRHTAGA